LRVDHIEPLGDLAFKKVFSSEDSKEVLAGLIHDFFGISPEKIILRNPYSIKAYCEQVEAEAESEDAAIRNVLRHTARDISARLELADFVVECQVRKEPDFGRRSLYYPFETYCSNYNEDRDEINLETLETEIIQSGRGERYASLRPVYSLNILGYNCFNDEHPLRILKLFDPELGVGLDEDFIKLAYFELTKDNVRTEAQAFWATYFKTGVAPDEAPEYIKRAAEIIRVVNLDQKERDMLSRQERGEELWASIELMKIREARQEGLDEGKAEGRVETARKMKVDGLDVALIAKYTGISVEEIKKL
jgi:hypothetical protein